MRYFLKLQYIGTHFQGWQSQPNGITIQDDIERALKIYFKVDVPITGCGRTDSGVHASGYYAHIDVEQVDKKDFIKKINFILHQDIVINSIIKVSEKAHARFDAFYRAYCYRLRFDKIPFRRHLHYHFPYSKKPSIKLLHRSAELIKDGSDFEGFSKVGSDVNHYRCEIYDCFWVEVDGGLEFHISANRFLRGMVRLLVGASINLGLEKLSVQEFWAVLETGQKPKISWSVPAHGLSLTEVKYPFL